jgi:hypothetical protein
MCLAIALAAWPTAVARAAALPDGCVAGLPANLTTQLKPLLQALGDATGQSLDCAAPAPDVAGSEAASQRQSNLALIAQTLALLAMADPGYGYAAPGNSYAAPGACN